MKNEYKIKFDNGQIVGPLTKKQIGVLYIYGHICGNEHYHKVNEGDWGNITSYPELLTLIEEIIDGKIIEENLISKKEKEILKKILDDVTQVLEKSLPEIDKTKKLFQEFKFKKDEEGGSTRIKQVNNGQASLDKTVLRRDINPKITITDKTKVAQLQVPFADEKDPLILDEHLKEKEELPLKNQASVYDKTEVVSLKSILPSLKKELKEAESEFEKKILLLEEDVEDQESLKELTKIQTIIKKIPKGKKTKWITAFAFIVVFYVLLFPEENSSGNIKVIYPVISFPVVHTYLDKPKAIEAYELGKKEYAKNTYVSKIKAAKYFETSLKHMFRDQKKITLKKNQEVIENNPNTDQKDNVIIKEVLSPAIYWLAIIYSEILNNSKNKSEDSNIIFRLLQIANTKTITEEKAALAAGIFYLKIGKFKTAAYIIEKYVLMATSGVKKKQLSNKLLAYRLHILMKAGMVGIDPVTDRNDAEETFQYLLKQSRGPLEMYIFCAEYLEFNQRFEDAEKILFKASQFYKNSVWLILKFTEYALRNKDINKVKHNLQALELLKLENCPEYYAKYLEYKGISIISEKQFDLAAKYFNKSLKLLENDELRSKLAELELKGGEFEKFLILESKIKDLMKSSQKMATANQWENAFKYAVEAADASSTYIPSHIWLAHIQLKKGYFTQAIEILEKLARIYPTNTTVNINLVAAYVEANLIDKALQKLSILSRESRVSNDPAFYSLLGRAYVKHGKISIGIRYIKKGLNIHNLNDDDYYYLAKLFLQFGQVSESKRRISTALTLQPDNLEYICFYSELLYESDGADVAIGFLRNEIRSRGEDVKLLSQIAIFYYRSGQNKLFEKTKNKITSLGTSEDPSLYKFLLKTAELDGNLKSVVEYAKKISILEPGDIDNKVNLASTYLELKRFPEGHAIIDDVLERMPTYKMANYYKARLLFNQGDFQGALTSGASESLYFPNSEFGFLIQGMAMQEMANQENDMSIKAKMLNDSTKFFENAISRNRDSFDALKNLGQLKYRQGQYDIAREYYLRVWNIDKADPEANKQLGYIYKQIGQGDLAVEYFQNYLDLRKDAPDRASIEEELSVLR
ncbi:MAG: hypothetical protein A2381_08880 [Bdellovibrionales bacterium RIFOXYB1_FULL_37_110]|nr:MAG: hypothetical protein A2181_09075 [Bdellovibrionales bacterium RIFOXYA1_FULL_38_20]OFZ50342.1 MAG: hypothetical protein A2417_08980 [Bdellovibrionales bacterium RIFOXYC1_FULL_37_79]OFZ60951.1 MAG: hypothetical protein A2381_08880 [Bdellovibrionales bacterium RIFOXYB1_FULL_37_110]OFZ63695.1 MAG: hypothetical protein A2577_08000 [Bdellovibrionales bacterium RIFOXYD1_FULL_36_51]